MASFPIIDPHIHLWDPKNNPRAASPFIKLFGWNRWLLHNMPRLLLPRAVGDFVGRAEYLVAPFLPPQYTDDHGDHEVVGYVYIEASWTGRGRLAHADETRWIETESKKHDDKGPALLGIVGAADLRRDDLADLLAAHKEASPRFVGVRDKIAYSRDRRVMNFGPQDDLTQDPNWRRGFGALAEHGLTFDAWLYDHQLDGLDAALGEHPEVQVVLDHLGSPVGVAGPFASAGADEAERQSIRDRWHDAIARLAEHPQLHAKLSGMFMPILGWGMHERPEPPSVQEVQDALGPFVEHALTCFGPSRCMFASNFPMDKVSLPYRTLYDAYRGLVATRDEAEQRALFFDNAVRLYGLDPR